MKSLVLMTPEKGWAASAKEALLPGAHVIALGRADVGIQGRLAGLEVRDTIAIVSPGAVRFGFLLRKPCVEATIAAQVLSTGTGVINVDGCRIASGGEHFRSTVAGRAGGMVTGDTRKGAALGMFQPEATFEPTNHTGGRWPSNLVFVHGPECREAGTKKVRGSHDHPRQVGMGREGNHTTGIYGAHASKVASVYTEGDGTETVTSWDCQASCPVKALDQQSGPTTSTVDRNLNTQPTSTTFAGSQFHARASRGDSGGASRFYPQFRDDQELEAWLTKLITPPE